MAARILQGDVFKMLPTIEPGSVDCCVTSPPYWQLRSYLPKGHPLKKFELGSEKTPAEYVANMVKVFRLVRDALADHGTCWVNVGDTYFGDSPVRSKASESFSDTWDESQTASRGGARRSAERIGGMVPGTLCLIPWRLAIALQDDGWIIRSIPIWHKPAPMPQSMTGWAWRRCRVKVRDKPRHEWNGKAANVGVKSMGGTERGNGHEVHREPEWSDCPGCKKCDPNGGYVLRKGSWRPTSSYEPILMLAKSAKYFCDGEPVKTPAALATISRDQYTRVLDDPDEQFAAKHDHEEWGQGGANLRDVWRIAAEPLKAGHYAAYPTELVRKCLQAGVSEKGYCPTCGGPWVRVVESSPGNPTSHKGSTFTNGKTGHTHGERVGQGDRTEESKTIGWRPSCTCHAAEPRPGLVLDPFCGSGRTAQAAGWLGMDFVGTELNPAYVEMAQEILSEDSPLFMRK